MSGFGNLKDQGNKGHNTPFQLGVLLQLKAIQNAISAIPGVDYETRTTTYQAIAPGPGYGIGDIIVRYDVIDVATATLVSTLWFNQTLQTVIPPPPPATLTPYLPPGNVTVTNPFNLEATQLSVLATLTPVVDTPGLLRVTGAGSISAGAKSVSVYNAGAADGLWLGVTIKPGEQFSYSAAGLNNTLAAFTYDGTGTELVITTLV